jgi:hypothetical protein
VGREQGIYDFLSRPLDEVAFISIEEIDRPDLSPG